MRISDWSSDGCSSDLVAHSDLAPGRSCSLLRFSYARFCFTQHPVRNCFNAGPLLEELPDVTRQIAVIMLGTAIEPFGCDFVTPLGVLPSRAGLGDEQIGRASCRERVCQYG